MEFQEADIISAAQLAKQVANAKRGPSWPRLFFSFQDRTKQKRHQTFVLVAFGHIWHPQGDSNPCYRRERAVS